MIEPFVGLMKQYTGFFLVITGIMMIVFVTEGIGRIVGRTKISGRRIFTIIHITVGGCVAALMLFAFREPIAEELQSRERVTPWMIGLGLSIITAVFIRQGSKTTK